MCKVRDAAMHMVNASVDLAHLDEQYYIDFYKLHKLMYYAQGYMITKYHRKLFVESIEAHSCGPFIPALLSLHTGFNRITAKYPENEIFPLTGTRIEAINYVLERYGNLSTDELIHLSKDTNPYKRVFSPTLVKTIPVELLDDPLTFSPSE